MFGFPPILDGNAGIKFTRDADSGFPKPGIREIFYSIKDGNWTDTTVWQTASGRVGLLPSANDDVYVRNTLQIPTANTFVCNTNSLFISNTGSVVYPSGGGGNIVINDRFVCKGIINVVNPQQHFLTINTTGQFDELTASNFIGTSLIIRYARNGDQRILSFSPAYTIYIDGTGIKTLSSNVTLVSLLLNQAGTGSPTLDLSFYDFTVNGTTTMFGNSRIIKTGGGGSVLFVGILGVSNIVNGIDFSMSNPNVELRGGITSGVSNPSAAISTGTGTWSFTTNNQTINSYNPFIFDANVIIGSGVTLTLGINGGGLSLNNTINGTDGTSVLRMNLGTLNFATAASVPSMTTGTWDFTTNANTIQYNGNYSATIPSYFTNFHSLTIGGTGTKTLGVNTTLNGALSVPASATLQLSTFNLSVAGNTSISGTLLKSGGGNVIFNLLSVNFQSTFDFSAGNPTVEVRGGITNILASAGMPTLFKTGTGTWTFSTTNQNISVQFGGSAYNFDCPIIINNITLTISYFATSNPIITFSNSCDGTTAGSTLLVAGTLYLNNPSFPVPMTTGVFDRTTNSTSVIGYTFNGNYTLPYTSWNGLAIGGTGAKTLSGNTTVTSLLILSPGNLELSTFDFTNNGATGIIGSGNTQYGLLSKSGAGNVLFVGNISLSNFGGNINFSGGNPNVELRGGFGVLNGSTNAVVFNTGTGTWTFSTNDQVLQLSFGTYTFDCNILISGARIITMTGASQTYIFKGTLNGDNAGSTFRMGTTSPTLNYQNATQPMATGILDTSTNLNTFIYGAGNQQVKGNPTAGQFQQYRNLRFSGNGTTKTLQGNINVQNTYTVDAGVTVNLNGFTKTP